MVQKSCGFLLMKGKPLSLPRISMKELSLFVHPYYLEVKLNGPNLQNTNPFLKKLFISYLVRIKDFLLSICWTFKTSNDRTCVEIVLCRPNVLKFTSFIDCF